MEVRQRDNPPLHPPALRAPARVGGRRRHHDHIWGRDERTGDAAAQAHYRPAVRAADARGAARARRAGGSSVTTFATRLSTDRETVLLIAATLGVVGPTRYGASDAATPAR